MLRSRFKLEEGWTTLLLLTSMLLSVVWSVRAADWTDGLGILPWTALASVLVGVVLAKARRKLLITRESGVFWITSS